MENLTDHKREFLNELRDLLIKYRAEITTFENEVIIEFPDSLNLWTGNYNISAETLAYHLSS